MKKKTKRFVPFLALYPQSWSNRCVSSGDVATIQGFECLFRNVLRVATTFCGLAFGVMLIVGGFKFILSGGDPKGTQSAQKTITTAFAGLVLTLALWIILRFVEQFTGLKVTEFNIPGGTP